MHNNTVRKIIFEKFIELMCGERRIVAMQFQKYCMIWNYYNICESEVRKEFALLCEEQFIEAKDCGPNPTYVLTEKGLRYLCP